MSSPSLTRRRFLSGSAAAGAVAIASCAPGGRQVALAPTAEPLPTTSQAALRRLLDGNARFARGEPRHPGQDEERRDEVSASQQPWAVVFGCIDSRVPPEVVFDQGLGDLFVTRTAGHVLDDAAMGSVEFAAAEFATPLIVVLGHQRCGAVGAAIDSLEAGASPPGSIGAIVRGIAPAVEEARRAGGDLTDGAVRANVRGTVASLESSPVIAGLLEDGSVDVVGAYYSLETGRVTVVGEA